MRTLAKYGTILMVMIAFAIVGYRTTSPAGAEQEVMSFDMWCLEMKLLPSARCDVRRPDDVKAYEQYRAEVEKFDSAKTSRAQRDQELQQKLNPDPGPKSGMPVRQ